MAQLGWYNGQFLAHDGTKTAPGLGFGGDTDTGFYSISSGVFAATVNGTPIAKFQAGPDRIIFGTDADTLTATVALTAEGPDGGFKNIRTAAAESFIAVISDSGAGGAQLRGMTTEGARITSSDSLTEFARFTEIGNSVGFNSTPTAMWDVREDAGASNMARFRTSSNLNTMMYTSGKMQIMVGDSFTESAATLGIGNGNVAANTNAAIQLGFNSGSDLKFNNYIADYHNGGSAAGNGIKIWTWDPAGSGSPTDFPNDVLITASFFGGRGAIGLENPDAIFDISGAVDPLADLNDPSDYQLYIQNPTDTNGEGSGIVFATDASKGSAGSAIIHERTGNNSQGHLNIYTQQGAANADPVLVTQHQDNGVFRTAGGNRINTTDVNSSTYTVLEDDDYLQVRRTSSGTCTITLPAIAASNEGQVYKIKDSGYNSSANNITINTTGADTIQNAASALISNDGDSLSILANSTTSDWELF